jgi:hypothetical protein
VSLDRRGYFDVPEDVEEFEDNDLDFEMMS